MRARARDPALILRRPSPSGDQLTNAHSSLQLNPTRAHHRDGAVERRNTMCPQSTRRFEAVEPLLQPQHHAVQVRKFAFQKAVFTLEVRYLRAIGHAMKNTPILLGVYVDRRKTMRIGVRRS